MKLWLKLDHILMYVFVLINISNLNLETFLENGHNNSNFDCDWKHFLEMGTIIAILVVILIVDLRHFDCCIIEKCISFCIELNQHHMRVFDCDFSRSQFNVIIYYRMLVKYFWFCVICIIVSSKRTWRYEQNWTKFHIYI